MDGLARWLDGTLGLRVILGHARFVAPHAIEVNGETLEAPRIFINVGARPMLPDWPGIADMPVLTNTSMMDLDVLPEHLVVIGASYIGLEFAQMFRRFGSQVSVLEYADRVIAREDPEVSHEVQAILEREGVRFLLGVREAEVSRATGDAPIRIALKSAGVAQEVHGSHLLAAVGRRPNSDWLDLDRAGIATDARGFITVDDQLRTNLPAYGRSATSMDWVPSPTPPTTTTRSSRPTCSTAKRAAPPIASPPMRSLSTRRSGGSA